MNKSFGENVQEIQKLRQAYGALWDSFPWSHFVTLTYRNEASATQAQTDFKRWHRGLESEAQGPVLWVMTIEGANRGRTHIHALLEGTRSVSEERVVRGWKHGLTHVDQFDPERGAAFYISKDMPSGQAEWDLDRRLRTATLPTMPRVTSSEITHSC